MDIHLINQKLRDYYGIDVASNLPNYRIVWSENELEKRKGLFQTFTPSGIFVRAEYGVREVKKYNYLDPQYILEKLTPNINNPEIAVGMTYEPLWCFGKQKELVWRAVDLLIRFSQNPRKPFTEQELDNLEQEQIARDERIMAKLLEENVKNDSFHSSVRDGDTVILDNVTLVIGIENRNYHVTTIDDCCKDTHVQIKGTVTLVRKEEDGDIHFRISDEHDHFIVCEIIPEIRIRSPKLHQTVNVYGISRYDEAHGWHEIHPVERIVVVK